MTTRVSMPPQPAKLLGLDPQVHSLSDVQTALNELSWIDGRETTLAALSRERVEQINAEFGRKMVVDVDGIEVNLSDRRAALKAAIEQFATANPDLMTEGAKRSRKFSGGHTVGWRKQAAAVTYQSGETSRSVTARVIEQVDGFGRRCVEFLQGLRLWGRGKNTRHADQVVDLKPALNLKRVADLYDRGELSDDDLQKLGLTHRDATELFYVKPAELKVQSQPAE